MNRNTFALRLATLLLCTMNSLVYERFDLKFGQLEACLLNSFVVSYGCHWLPTGDNAVAYISDGLRHNRGLELLLLADNPFGDDGGLNLVQVLCRENLTLRVLDIHGTRMTQQTEQKVRTYVWCANIHGVSNVFDTLISYHIW